MREHFQQILATEAHSVTEINRLLYRGRDAFRKLENSQNDKYDPFEEEAASGEIHDFLTDLVMALTGLEMPMLPEPGVDIPLIPVAPTNDDLEFAAILAEIPPPTPKPRAPRKARPPKVKK